MEVKRFISSSMQEALKLVREEFGPDAVILSNSKVDNGVEIVAALDYEEDVAPSAIDSQLSKQGQPSPSQIARMHADNHIRLQKELDSARKKIESVRAKKQKEQVRVAERGGAESDVVGLSSEGSSRHEGFNDDKSLSDQLKSQDVNAMSEIGEMRSQLAELKNLITEQNNSNVSTSHYVEQESASKLQVQKKLDALSLSPSVTNTLIQMVDNAADYATSWKRIIQRMAYLITSDDEELIDRGGRYALVGPTGSGKTMTIGKLAARYVMKYGSDSIALVTTDRYRIAAHEQLKVFGRILNVPVHAVNEHSSLDDILKKLSSKKLVLIDTAGLTHLDSSWSEQLQEIKMAQDNVECYLTVSSVGQYQVMCSSYQHYKIVGLRGAIITKLDEAVSLGEVISFLIDTGLSAAYFTDGQRVPEDIHQFREKVIIEKAQSLLNSAERWVSIDSVDSFNQDNLLFSHSA